MDKETRKDIEERSYKFAIEIIKIVSTFPQKTVAFILGKQIIRSGTSVNSNIIHAKAALGRKEFTYYLNIAKKEAKETKSWLQMCVDSELVKLEKARPLLEENEEIIKILVKSVKTLQTQNKN